MTDILGRESQGTMIINLIPEMRGEKLVEGDVQISDLTK